MEVQNDNLEINEKLFGFRGILGRHGFFLNLVKTFMITTFFLFPIIVVTLLYAENPFAYTKMYWYSPLFIQILTILGVLLFSALFIPSMVKRLNDIFGTVNKIRNIIFSILIFISICNLMPGLFNFICKIFLFVIILILLFNKGKITSKLPYDYKKEFNWGAFFGTWIWGIVNKSFVPLWSLLLHFTPIGFFFKIFCGLKGNEWAYKNKNWNDVPKFNKSQRLQTLIFTILSLVIFPIISFIFVMIILFAMIFFFSIKDYEQYMEPQSAAASPQIENKAEQFESGYFKFLNFLAYLNFEEYEITEEENKFYVTSIDWKFSTYSDKRDLMNLAAITSAEYKNQLCKKQQKPHCKYHTKNDELPKTKIYNIKNNQVLGEFYLDPAINNCKDCKFSDYMKMAINAYKFYNAED